MWHLSKETMPVIVNILSVNCLHPTPARMSIEAEDNCGFNPRIGKVHAC